LGESEGLMAKLENIIMLGETFVKTLRLLDPKSLNEKELLELDDLKDRINGHLDFFLVPSDDHEEEVKGGKP
jgi:hypothetical protein